MIRKMILGLGLLGLAVGARAQSINYVTEIVTTYRGIWQSGSGNVSAILPDSSHYLLAFSANGIRYSTGVSDARLTKASLTFKPGKYRALPVSAISAAPTSLTKVGLGQLYDKVDNGPSSPPPVRDLARYLTDGPNGLDIGTGVANIPAGLLTFTAGEVQQAAINDGVPDILVTQFADPAGSSDVYSFLDANDVVVGKAVTVTYSSSFPVVGRWMADFYEGSQSPMTLAGSFTKTPRDLRLWTADFSDFGIVPADYNRIAKFQVKLSGSSDVAFVAYNSQALTVLPVELTYFRGRTQASGQVHLAWRTASEQNAEKFVVEASSDGHTFVPVGEVPAAGTVSTSTDYAFQHRPTTSGITYYRLHQIDVDGTSAYSPVEVVSTGASQSVETFPNPFAQTLTLTLSTTAGESGEARLLSLTGQVLSRHPFTVDELSTGVCTLDKLPTLPAGLYLLQLVVDGQSTLCKVRHE
ncbi:T9SS type A sorting domain-containing protein [Hymenobacter sp. GOD-10R]|uniref:T9SS type A sorting domain-containing protein n=1 Tax=Hymenobacter sp. GOD-10R TaxID=3093922 RepID=UPI002D76EC10|nr:T9SS type A sorting domain-containing protein [Hymenobacter sp. GOD-10R]WRQ26230.1 T9SS type A sorting domain-containing protein [Hymenobacter sp. GOD-10R]